MEYTYLFLVVGFPNRVAFDTNIEILHVFVVVAHINDFRRVHLIHIGLACNVGTSHVINARQRRVEFRVAIDDVVEPLFAFLQLGVENTHTIFAYFVVDELAVATIICEIVSVRLGNRDIKHIGAIVAEFHRVYMVYCDKLFMLIYRFNFYLRQQQTDKIEHSYNTPSPLHTTRYCIKDII